MFCMDMYHENKDVAEMYVTMLTMYRRYILPVDTPKMFKRYADEVGFKQDVYFHVVKSFLEGENTVETNRAVVEYGILEDLVDMAIEDEDCVHLDALGDILFLVSRDDGDDFVVESGLRDKLISLEERVDSDSALSFFVRRYGCGCVDV